MSRPILVPLAGFLVLCLAAPGRADDDGQKVARETLDKAVKALGGADALAKLKTATLKMKNKARLNDSVDLETSDSWSIKGLDKIRVDTSVKLSDNNFDAAVVIAGAKGWQKVNGKTTDLSKETAAALRNTVRAARLVHVLHQLKDKPFELSPLGEMKVEGLDAVGLRVIEKDQPDVSLFFDKKTGLPVKSEVRVIEADGGQEILIEIFFADFKDFDGVKHFAKATVKRDGKTLVEADVQGVKPEELDDSTFDKP